MSLPVLAESAAPALMPVRMLNEFAYCPRLFFLEWVQGEFAGNFFTADGVFRHRRVDAVAEPLPEEAAEKVAARSVELSSEALGLSGKVDVVELQGGEAVPVDYKRGKPPPTEERCNEPERVQLCAYGLLLRERGYASTHGFIYFAESKTRVRVDFTETFVARTQALVAQARAAAQGGAIPPPLENSPKCNGCSLQGICLPDEVNLLNAQKAEEPAQAEPRRFWPARDDAVPLYAREPGARVGLAGEVLEVRCKGELLATARLIETSHLVLMGNVQVSSQALRELGDRDIPVCWTTYNGWLTAVADGLGHKNVGLRRAQYRAADDPARCLALARRFVRAKVANCRTLLRRNAEPAPEAALRELKEWTAQAETAASLGELLGMEGNAARAYFGAFRSMLKVASAEFDFTARSRRPPADPVNALLSYAYSLLTKDLALACRLTGLDPYLGFYHQLRYGKPALALDLMEEFRPLIADSVVVNALNTGVVGEGDFLRSSLGVSLKPDARKSFIRAYERRLAEEVTHPVFGYRISYRRVLEVQCRLLAKHLAGELADFPEFRTR